MAFSIGWSSDRIYRCIEKWDDEVEAEISYYHVMAGKKGGSN
jgi:hypothetical protein